MYYSFMCFLCIILFKNTHSSWSWNTNNFLFNKDHDDFISKEEIDYYVNLISNAQTNGLYAQLPINARQHAPKYKEVTELGTFDFIIVGAGSAGTVLVNRLSEVKKWKVLLLEAGDFGNNLTDIPNMYFPVEYTKYNWGFFSTPQKTSCLGMVGNRCPLPRGKGIGGSTLINGLVYSRGSPIDYDKWAAIGNPGWSYEDVLPYFKKSENFNHRDVQAPVDYLVHGEDGYLHVEYHLPRSPQLDAFIQANQEIGVPNADYNSFTGLGASAAQINTLNGRRFDGGKAFVHPILHRKNVHVMTQSYVMRVLFKNHKEVGGVLFAHNGRLYRARARKEVILSAGTYQSAQLLMLSGIGPKHHLESVGIPVIADLRVGKFLDHPTFYGLNFGTNYTEPTRPLAEYVKEYLKGFGPLAAPGNNQGVAFYESSYTKGTGLPDIELMMIPSNATTDLSQRSFNLDDETYQVVWGRNNPSNTFILYVICLHGISEGTIKLKNKNPFEYPQIDTNFLSDPHNKDINTLYEGVQIGLELASTNAFQKIGTTLQGGPLKQCSQYRYPSKSYWYCALRQMTMDIYHPVGSCRMGPDPRKGAVVDANCRVHGIKNLRVVDGSVMPFTISGHPNAPIVMIAEKVSDLIKTDYLDDFFAFY